MAAVQISDVIVPSVFSRYVRQRTTEKWNLLQSGVIAIDAFLGQLLENAANQVDGGGINFDIPSWRPLSGTDVDNVSSDSEADIFRLQAGTSGTPSTTAMFPSAARTDAIPRKLGTSRETAVRLSRNQSWSASDLASRLAGNNAMDAIADLVGDYWMIRRQKAVIASLQGVFADNAAAPSTQPNAGIDTHTLNDLTLDVSGASFTAGVTNITAESVIDALATMGDSSQDIVAMMVHSTVMATLRKNNLIDFRPDSNNPDAQAIPTFLGRDLIEDDAMPNPSGDAAIGANTASGIYHTWLLGRDAIRYGEGTPSVPTAVFREELAGMGGGQEILVNRQEWIIHPSGYRNLAGNATTNPGGPANGSGAGTLSNAASWTRQFPERKQIRIARLITRES